MNKIDEIWVSDAQPHREFGGLAQSVHTAPLAGQEPLVDHYPWKDNAWFVFWDPDQKISAMVHCSTSFNGAPRTARAVLACEGRILTIDEVPEIGTLSSASINVDGAIEPGGGRTGPHRVTVSSPEFALDLTLTPRWKPMDWTVLHVVPALGDAPELNHLQQGYNAQGTVRLGEKHFAFNGGGFRDRTWGWRQESGQWHELYAATIGLEKCDISMCKFLLGDGSTTVAGFIQTDAGMHQVLDATLLYSKTGLAGRLIIEAEGLDALEIDVEEIDAGWWLTFTKANSKAPVWTEYEQLGPFDGGPWGRGYGCIPQAILRRLS